MVNKDYQYHYQTSFYSLNLWRTYTSMNVPSQACFIFFVVSKTENQLKFHKYSAPLSSCLSRDTSDFIIHPTCGFLKSQNLVQWITESWQWLQERVYEELVQVLHELRRRLIDSWSSIQQTVIDQAIDRWWFRWRALVRAREVGSSRYCVTTDNCFLLIHNVKPSVVEVMAPKSQKSHNCSSLSE